MSEKATEASAIAVKMLRYVGKMADRAPGILRRGTEFSGILSGFHRLKIKCTACNTVFEDRELIGKILLTRAD